MLEEKLTIDCKTLAERDSLSITLDDNMSFAQSQYLGLIEDFIKYAVEEKHQVRFDTLVATHKALGILKHPEFEILMSDDDGAQYTKIKFNKEFKGELMPTITKIRRLYSLFNNIRNKGVVQVEIISKDPKNEICFDSEFYRLTYNHITREIFFERKAKKTENCYKVLE